MIGWEYSAPVRISYLLLPYGRLPVLGHLKAASLAFWKAVHGLVHHRGGYPPATNFQRRPTADQSKLDPHRGLQHIYRAAGGTGAFGSVGTCKAKQPSEGMPSLLAAGNWSPLPRYARPSQNSKLPWAACCHRPRPRPRPRPTVGCPVVYDWPVGWQERSDWPGAKQDGELCERPTGSSQSFFGDKRQLIRHFTARWRALRAPKKDRRP